MADMLVKLYALPEVAPLLGELRKDGIEIRRAQPFERHVIVPWVRDHFVEAWAHECDAALRQAPVGCFVAVERTQAEVTATGPYDQPSETLIGFACYDATRKGMFGPEGVRRSYHGRGIGKALLLACLHAMKDERYAYAVIGWAGPKEFYARTVAATVIDGSEPGVYGGPLIGHRETGPERGLSARKRSACPERE
jgi:GNAT superfamily N-acetyltransferase